MNVTGISSGSSASSPDFDALNAQYKAQGKQSLNEDDFFKLLTAQLSAQDPLKPMDDTSFISQMASFSSLQQMQSLSKDMSDFTTKQQVANANTYLGKTVTATDDTGAAQTGSVTAINISDGVASLVVNGANCGVASVTNVSSN